MTTTDSPDAVATVRGDEGASVLGPDNVAIALQNPGAAATDSGSLPNLKFPFAAAHNRLQTGGWAREVTVRELPVATTLAAVNMRLNAGAYRELHWHKEAEWAFMLSGSARIAAIDP
jgi:oxalate decarboxylase